MAGLVDLLAPHASWIFGSGGVAAIFLAMLKFLGKSKEAPRSDTPTSQTTTRTELSEVRAGGSVAGGNIQTRNGLGSLEIAIILSAVVCIVGLFLFLSPNSSKIDIKNQSVVNQGNGNDTVIQTGK